MPATTRTPLPHPQDPQGPDNRLLSYAECAEIIRQITELTTEGGETVITITSWWNGELRWARNRVTVGADRRDITISVTRGFQGGSGSASINQYDKASLAAVVHAAERIARYGTHATFDEMEIASPTFATPAPVVWSDATYTAPISMRGELVRRLTDGAERKGMLSAGYLEMRGLSNASIVVASEDMDRPKSIAPVQETSVDTMTTGATPSSLSSSSTYAHPRSTHELRYDAFTQAQCSMTVRHPKGTASGWAGLSGYDWAQIDAVALADRALDKCLQSIDPVRVEPGRYTVVLEPQAVCDLVELLFWSSTMSRTVTEKGQGPFVLGFDERLHLWRSKLGLQVIDSRITIDHDPLDPQLGVAPSPGLKPITWIDHGILTTLEYDRPEYALPALNDNLPATPRRSFRMSGGTTSIADMISSTKRGLLVTRFSNLGVLDSNSLLATGVTRDGLWLIEQGKISKAVKNMRMTESPLFVLNQVEQLGVPVPIFRPSVDPETAARTPSFALQPAIVPPLKSNDFSFTALNDAI